MTLCHNVGHLLAFMAEEQPPPRPEELASVARSITHTTVAIEVMRQSFKTEAEGQLAPSLATLQRLAAKSFGRSADHQLTEHSEGDDRRRTNHERDAVARPRPDRPIPTVDQARTLVDVLSGLDQLGSRGCARRAKTPSPC